MASRPDKKKDRFAGLFLWANGKVKAPGSASADMAIRFEKAFGVKADTLMRMQSAYEMAQARAHEDEIRVTRLVAA
ncbi:helix-turn-helix transcriptional regulator [Acetobacter garciniae]|uniref:helix-turn-helix transcriptional regulator n=1 Tax=Acetobacter garciniae TaxID=2817435 RepID=UPI0038B3D98B